MGGIWTMFKCCSFCYLVIGPCCFFMVVMCSLLLLVVFPNCGACVVACDLLLVAVICGGCSHFVGVHQWDTSYLHYLLFDFYHCCYLWFFSFFGWYFLPFAFVQFAGHKWCIVSLFRSTTWQPWPLKNYMFFKTLFLCFYFLFCLCVDFLLFVVLSFVSLNFFLMLKYFCNCIYLHHRFFCIWHHLKSEWSMIAHHTCKCL